MKVTRPLASPLCLRNSHGFVFCFLFKSFIFSSAMLNLFHLMSFNFILIFEIFFLLLQILSWVLWTHSWGFLILIYVFFLFISCFIILMSLISLKALGYGFSLFVLMFLWCVFIVSRDVILFLIFFFLSFKKNLPWSLTSHENSFSWTSWKAWLIIAFLISRMPSSVMFMMGSNEVRVCLVMGHRDWMARELGNNIASMCYALVLIIML